MSTTDAPQRPKRWRRAGPGTPFLAPSSSHLMHRHRDRGPSTGKIRYRYRYRNDTKALLTNAVATRASRQADSASRRRETRAYWCHHCGGWHFISAPTTDAHLGQCGASRSRAQPKDDQRKKEVTP